MNLNIFVLLCCVFSFPFLTNADQSPPPMVFVPGLTESNLEAQVFGDVPPCGDSVHKKHTLFPIQGSEVDNREDYECFLKQMTSTFNPADNTINDTPGVNVSTVDFGTFFGMKGWFYITSPYVKEGWKLGHTYFAAPYDWRKPSDFQGDYFSKLQALVEKAYSTNNNRKVVLIAPSGGPQLALSFLHRMTQAWKDQHIDWFVAESPVWSGSPTALVDYVSGAGVGNAYIVSLARTGFASPWYFPRLGDTNSTWSNKEVIISTPSKNYTAADYAELVLNIGMDENTRKGVEYVIGGKDLFEFDAPGVDTLVTYGYGIGTPGNFIYPTDFYQNPLQIPLSPVVINSTDTGDGIVTVRSSLRSTAWASDQAKLGKKLLHRSFANQQHALCLLPQGGECFYQVMALLKNGTVPPLQGHAAKFTVDVGLDLGKQK